MTSKRLPQETPTQASEDLDDYDDLEDDADEEPMDTAQKGRKRSSKEADEHSDDLEDEDDDEDFEEDEYAMDPKSMSENRTQESDLTLKDGHKLAIKYVELLFMNMETPSLKRNLTDPVEL